MTKPKFRYMIVSIDTFEPKEEEKRLNIYGEDGWEVCAWNGEWLILKKKYLKKGK